MILSGNFFYVTERSHDNGSARCMIEFNKDHKIFKGHFPGRPVVPGVCMMQLIKEILESSVAKPTRLISAGNLKFLSVIDPGQSITIRAEVKYLFNTDGNIHVTGSLTNERVTYFKMNGVFKLQE
ncbi:MAG: hypothetical protein WKI04_06260 [Ferruginibacter sp.]